MEFTTYSGILTQQVLNETTGELEVKQYREEIKRTKLKGGFATTASHSNFLAGFISFSNDQSFNKESP